MEGAGRGSSRGAVAHSLVETRAYLAELRAMHTEGLIDDDEMRVMRREALNLHCERFSHERRRHEATSKLLEAQAEAASSCDGMAPGFLPRSFGLCAGGAVHNVMYSAPPSVRVGPAAAAGAVPRLAAPHRDRTTPAFFAAQATLPTATASGPRTQAPAPVDAVPHDRALPPAVHPNARVSVAASEPPLEASLPWIATKSRAESYL